MHKVQAPVRGRPERQNMPRIKEKKLHLMVHTPDTDTYSTATKTNVPAETPPMMNGSIEKSPVGGDLFAAFVCLVV